MKNIKDLVRLSAISLTTLFTISSCSSFLDVDPELGLTEEEVFETYANFRSYYDWMYDTNGGNNMEKIHNAFPFYYDLFQRYAFSWYNTTDMSDAGRLGVTQQYFKQGILTQDFLERVTFNGGAADNKPICLTMFTNIRRCNMTIANIDMCKNATEEQINELLGQAYAIRGFAHFALCRMFGGMPYLDHPLMADEEWDIPRLSAHETYLRAAEDLKIGADYLIKAGFVRRNTPEDLSGANLLHINGAAAMALRARSLLYAASELNNELGIKDWEAAAEAAAEALKVALDAGFTLLTADKYTTNFLEQITTNETIWGYNYNAKDNHANFRSILAHPQSANANASGVCPTQNFVDRYETKYGDPLFTEEERKVAEEQGHYHPQNPYANLDPRFELTIVHDGSKNPYVTGAINIYYDPVKKTWPVTTNISNVKNVAFGIEWGSKDNAPASYTNTGYYCKKYWHGKYGSKDNTHHHLDPIVRLAELYLNYAEAVNEAYGPTGTAGGMNITALEAINIIRNRIGMPDIQDKFIGSKEALRERIRNERIVELAFEGHHYYYDIRRWKIAPQLMNSTLYGMYIESIAKSADYPVGRKYERRPLPNNRQCLWKDYMYVIPFPDSEAYKMKNFVNNQEWR